MKKTVAVLVSGLLFLVSLQLQAASVSCESHTALVQLEGLVRVQHAGSAFPLRDLQLPHALCTDDRVITQTNARALIRHSGGELVLDGGSRLLVLDASGIRLEEGAGLFEVSQRGAAPFVVHTPLVVIGVKGTRFLVSSSDQRDDVALFRGLVGVERQDGREMAYYRAKPVSEMTFSEYRAYQQRAFQEYRNALVQAFEDYKKEQMAQFQAFVSGVDLQPGRQLTLGGSEDAPEVIDAPVNPALERLQRDLERWLR